MIIIDDLKRRVENTFSIQRSPKFSTIRSISYNSILLNYKFYDYSRNFHNCMQAFGNNF